MDVIILHLGKTDFLVKSIGDKGSFTDIYEDVFRE
jgi:hypothetical protein